MNTENIERISFVDKLKLSDELYFSSLLEEASCHGLLDAEDIENIQMACLELLAYKTERYTGGESSSVRIEVAESIMKSNLYTIGIYLKSFPCPDDAVKIIKEKNISDIYNCGLNIIESKIKSTKDLYNMVLENILETDNYTYQSTVVDGIKGFFKIYNADFEAHEIHITADYPICNTIENLVGIEFIEKYLESIYYENEFCRCFSPDNIHHLFCGYDEHYRDLIFNLFEQILTCAIGCTLAKKQASNLQLNALGIEQIYFLLSEKSKSETEIIIIDAYQKLMNELAITSFALKKYIEKAIPNITFNMWNAIKLNKPERVFIQPKYPEKNLQIAFSFGDKMDDEKYRDIINEITQCRFISDKVAIIKSNINSLADFEDMIFDAELTSEETNAVLNELDIMEISALAKRHQLYTELELIDFGESEKTFRLCLKKFISSLPHEKQLLITKAISMISDDSQ